MNVIHPSNLATLTPARIEGMAHVTRWHSRPVLRPQTVAEHSHQVALLALHLAPPLSDDQVAQLLFWALVHDAHEYVFGDIPFPAKEALARRGSDLDVDFQDRFWGAAENPLREFPDLVLDLVDVADVLEAARFASRWLPSLSDEIRAQAEDRIRTRFTTSETQVSFARAMTILEGLRHA